VSKAVLDASALLSLLQDEPGATDVQALLPEAAMSAVNLSEVLARLVDAGMPRAEARATVEALGIRFVDFDVDQAFEAAALRDSTRAYGLSLGDRACLGLAQRLGVPAVTADRVWARLRGGPTIRVVR
jgi:PIN domain nuclease of toxin-antitoxin system